MTGLLFVQLGTPENPTTRSVRKFLKAFLSDRRVVDRPPRVLWWLLLYGVILPTRARRSAALYRTIWNRQSGSPLLIHTKQQVDGVRMRLNSSTNSTNSTNPNNSKPLHIGYAMRHGLPNILTEVHAMLHHGVTRLLVFPLFPQYASSATASVMDGVWDALKSYRFLPALRIAPPFFDDPGYIQALAQSILETVQTTHRDLDRQDCVLFSFHGQPIRFGKEGDPYEQQCRSTAQHLAACLKLPESRWRIAFQSRFGREPWLEPATGHLLKELPKQGVRHLVIVCPGFVSDCLETLHEIAQEGRDLFLQAGGQSFTYVPCLNNHPAWLDALTECARREINNHS